MLYKCTIVTIEFEIFLSNCNIRLWLSCYLNLSESQDTQFFRCIKNNWFVAASKSKQISKEESHYIMHLYICRLDSYYYGANIDSHVISFSVYFCIWLASKVVYRNHFEYSYNVYKCNKYRSTTMWLIASQNDNKTRATKLKLFDFAMQ